MLVCVSKDPPETCAHFLTFHKVGVKYKYMKLLFSYQVGNLGQFTDLMLFLDKLFSHWLGPFINRLPVKPNTNYTIITQWPQIVFEMLNLFKKIVSSHKWWRIWKLLIPINFSPSSLFLVSLSLLLNWIKQMCVISDDDMCHSFFYCVIFLVKTNSNNKIHVQNMHFYLQYFFRYLTIKLCF